MQTTLSPKTELARKGEQLACEYLQAKGFVVLKRNYRIGAGELDIIARHGRDIVFVEVKTRESAYMTDPLKLVPVAKQRQVVRIADIYLKSLKSIERARFDIVIVVHNPQSTDIRHIEDAFYAM